MIFDEHAEKALIGALLQCEKPEPYLLRLNEDDMMLEAHKIILSAMQRLAGRREPFDFSIVAREAKKDARANAINADVIAIECIRNAPSAVMVEQYYRQVKNLGNRRRVQRIAQEMDESARDIMQEPDVVISEAMDKLRKISQGQDCWKDTARIMSEALDTIERMSKGEEIYLKTGIPDLDCVISGLFPGELTVLGARPAVGKSALAAFIGANIASCGKKVGICSLEMAPLQYAKRLIASRGGVSAEKLRTGKALTEADWDKIVGACSEMAGWQMPFTFSVKTIEDLEAETRRRIDTAGLDLLIVDYMQLLRTKKPAESNFACVTAVSHGLKSLALDMGIPVLALAQVARPERKGMLQMPTLDCLRGSGDIEQDADAIWFLHRPELPDDRSINPRHDSIARACMNGGPNQYVVLNVAKQRDGKTRMIDMIFDPEHMSYKCMA